MAKPIWWPSRPGVNITSIRSPALVSAPACVEDHVEANGVMRGELAQPVLHVAERLAVRRQDQRVRMQHVEERLAGLRNAPTASNSGSTCQVLTLVVMLGRIWSPAIRIFRSAQ